MYNHYHEIDENPETNNHLSEIVCSIRDNGWVGLPLLADGDQLLNGCHRATACEILGVEPEVHQIKIGCTWGDGEYTDALLRDFAEARGTQDLYEAIKALREEGLVDRESLDIIAAEYDKE